MKKNTFYSDKFTNDNKIPTIIDDKIIFLESNIDENYLKKGEICIFVLFLTFYVTLEKRVTTKTY